MKTTTDSQETKQPNENEPTRKLSLVSEDQNSPLNSQPEVPTNGQTPTLPQMPPELNEQEQKHMAKMIRKMAKRGVPIPPGMAWNPLLRLEPNRPCPCLSGRKFKACCRDKLAATVPESVAKDFEAQMAKEDLVFLTPDNHAKIEARIAPHVKANLEKQQAELNERAENEKRKIDEALKKRH